MQKNASPSSWVGDVLADSRRVVAEVLRAGGLDAGEDARHRCGQLYPTRAGYDRLGAGRCGPMAALDSTWSPSSWRDLAAAPAAGVARPRHARGGARAPARAAAARLRRRGAQAAGGARRGRGRPRRSCSRRATAPSRSTTSPDRSHAYPREARRSCCRWRRCSPTAPRCRCEGRPDRGPVRQAALARRSRVVGRRRDPGLPRPHGPRRRADRRGARPRPGADARGLPPLDRDAQPRCAPSPRAASPI